MTPSRLPDNLSMPACIFIPVLEYPDVAAAVKWLIDTFGFAERWHAGSHRAQLSFEDGAIVVTEANAAKPIAKATIMVRIKNITAHYERTCKQGAEIVRPPSDFPYGERQYSVKDPAGHLWTFSQTIANVAPEEWGGVSVKL